MPIVDAQWPLFCSVVLFSQPFKNTCETRKSRVCSNKEGCWGPYWNRDGYIGVLSILSMKSRAVKDISYMQIIGKGRHIIYSYVSPKIVFSKPCQTYEDRSRGC